MDRAGRVRRHWVSRHGVSRTHGVPAQMWRWLSQENSLRGLGDAEIMIVTSPDSPAFPTGFMDTLRYLGDTGRVTLRRAES